MSASKVLGISRYEFRQMLYKCVANSGGPDSTCLLFLLHRYLKDHGNGVQRLMSISVDHDLQPSSSAMAESSKVPWSTPPGEEEIARVARFEMLLRSMGSVIALGHHADDQVETALMRFGMGSTVLGAAGMKVCRRWGMGGPTADSLGWAGMDGMDKWIIRPLLDVTKDRILATCEENNLEYVTDESNFQPHITVRNAVRKLLTSGKSLNDVESACPEPLPPRIKEQLSRINTTLSQFESVSVDLSSGLERLHGLVKHLATRVDDIDGQVDRYLNRCAITSPPGTLLLSLRGLLLENDDLVRIALILRVMRYVSFYPWGSIRADGKRKRSMRDQILKRLWSLNPFENGRGPFVAGGGVLWTPVLVNGTRIKTPDRIARTGVGEGETIAWLASRQPPMKMRQMDGEKVFNPLHIDATETIKQKLEDISSGSSPLAVDLLYDCRFLVRLHLTKLPFSKLTEKYWMRGGEAVVADWIQVKWVRPLSRI
ncbi:hypothetical protein F5887DRAFT_1058581 [Amanita rubescens]|nr:hypothetical protein F5887DRAFT_1058581 [Amanita rubescens]